MQVYAVLHSPDKQYLMCVKNEYGYFFKEIVDKYEKRLNGYSRHSFPGGKMEIKKGDIITNAYREFWEETGLDIPELKPYPINHLISPGKYHAVYFCVQNMSLNDALARINNNLLCGQNVVDDFLKKTISKGAKIDRTKSRYKDCPVDNEQNFATLMNETITGSTVSTWRDDPDVGWFYEIIKHLWNNINI